MDIIATKSLSKTAISFILELYSDPTTSLKPLIPCFQLDSFNSYISDLNYPPPLLECIPKQIKDEWEANIYIRKKNETTDMGEQCLKGLALKHISLFLNNSEETAKQNLNEAYINTLDGVDRSTIAQISTFLSSTWHYISTYFTKHGKYMGYIGSEYYTKGKEFSFQQMMHHNATYTALVRLSFADEPFIKDIEPKIKELALNALTEYEQWYYRWQKSEKISDLNYVLKGQLDLYRLINQTLPQQGDVPPEISYPVKIKLFDLEEKLSLLKISFFNHMSDIKPKGENDRIFEEHVNSGAQWLNRQLGPVQKCPPFNELYDETLDLTKNIYDLLFPPFKIKKDFESVLNDYVKAVTEDNFSAAKWHSLSYETKTEFTPFNWKKEAESFENYKRKIDRLFRIQDHLDEIIVGLNQAIIETIGIFSQYTIYKFGIQTIHSCWKLRGQLDDLRIKLRLGFLKDVKTRVTHSHKNVWGRITQSLGNKAFRLALDGEVFDKTQPYEKVLNDLDVAFRTYRELLVKINDEIKNPLFSRDKTTSSQDDYFIFYDAESFVNYVNNPENVMKSLNLKVIKYNIERIITFQKNDYFSEHFKIIQSLFNCNYTYSLLKEAINNLISFGYKDTEKNYLKDANNTLNSIPIKSLGETYRKYVISEKNRRTPIDYIRIKDSALNKGNRLMKSGTVSNSIPEFPTIYPEIQKKLFHAAKNIKIATDELLKNQPILKLKLQINYLGICEWEGFSPVKLPFLPTKVMEPPTRKTSKFKEKDPAHPTITIIEDYTQLEK